ncbi:MAG TPA: hypothetical protein VGR28_10880 [Candidatus Thermoplasmatota archaeon]|nr:hypothetical protein [Candidatus Thermoplasmatota archaeon]
MRTRAWLVGVVAGLALAAPVGALTHEGGPIVKHIFPTLDAAKARGLEQGAGTDANNLIYHDGPIQRYPRVYLVFWAWLGEDPSGEAPYLQNFFAGVGGSSWANIQTQYDEHSTFNNRGAITNPPSQLAGVWFDDSLKWPPIPDLFIDREAQLAAQHFGDTDTDAGYIIATPHNFNDLQFGYAYCAWHSVTTYDGAPIAYTDLPYMTDAGGACGQNFVNNGPAGLLDGVSIVAGHEFEEMVTDPQIDAWYDSNGLENADKCAWVNNGEGAARNIVLPTGSFAVQSLWSNAISGCTTHHP